VDRTVLRAGKGSAFLKAPESDRPVFGFLFQEIRADHYRGKRVRFSAYIKTQGVGATRRSGARLDLLVLGKTHRFGGAPTRGRLIQGSTDWKQCGHVLDIPEEASLLFLGIVLVGPGQVWVDDVRLEVVGPEVPTTASTDRRAELSETWKQRVVERLRSARLQPVNLSFER
jgi:hypothetical protein